jgi:hypothetical protein
MGLCRSPLIRELIDLSKLSWNQDYDFLIHREKKTVTMTLWDSIDPSSTSWYAMFRGTFGDNVGFDMGDMIAAWTDQFTAIEEFDEYLQWEIRGGREGICVLVQFPVSDRWEIRSKTIGNGDNSLVMLDYHKPWWDFMIARNQNQLFEIRGEEE